MYLFEFVVNSTLANRTNSASSRR